MDDLMKLVESAAAVWDRRALEAELAQASAKMVEQAARIQQLEAEIAAMQWRPIETAPKDGTPLLLLWPDAAEKMAVMWWDEYVENWLGYYDGINPGYQPPTHWMPLPPPPAGEQE